jgi:hypothetical protein
VAMRVDVERSGGFAGLSRRRSMSESELAGPELQSLLELVRRFEGARSHADRRRAVPDRFQFDVTVADRGRKRHATVWEDELAPSERELLARLIQQSNG